MSDEQGIEITEDVETYTTLEGDVVTDDIVVAVDEATGDAIVDETITVSAADGSAAAEEIITAYDGETGEAEVVADIVGVVDAEGDAVVEGFVAE
jgi:ribosomal protein L18E